MNIWLRAICVALLVLPACAGPRRGSLSGPVEKVITHRVRQGESWQSIARDFYRDASRADELAAFNGSDGRHPPRPGAGVRVPFARADLELLEQELEAASVYNQGIERASEGNYGEAVELFQRALEIDPELLDASFNLAVTYQKLGLHAKAIPLLKDLANREPGRAAYHYALGHSYFHADELAEAKHAFTRALEIDSTHGRALYSLAVVCRMRGEHEDAIRHWDSYLELYPSGEWADEARARRQELLRSGRRDD